MKLNGNSGLVPGLAGLLEKGRGGAFGEVMVNKQYNRKRQGKTASLVAVAVALLLEVGVCCGIEMKGISYTAWQPDAMLTEDSDASLAKARLDGCNWVAICVWWFQDDVDSVGIEPYYTRYSAAPDSVVHAINRCHELGMKVMLKPMVDCNDGAWRGYIEPSDDWFVEYANFVNFWADVAEANSVELLCVGCELRDTVSWSASWRSVIEGIRTRYSGPLTYAANHGNETKIDWWGDLDYIGIDAYYSLTNKANPSLGELRTAWNDRADAIELWLNTQWPGMSVMFSEVGYQSVDGTNQTPWWTDPGASAIDMNEQAECYEALLGECKQRDWWLGAFWWNWETDPNGGGDNDPYWTPQNKPAEETLRDYYMTVSGDFDDDRDVDFFDVMFQAGHWLRSGVVGDADLNGDGKVNLQDFAMLGRNWAITASR